MQFRRNKKKCNLEGTKKKRKKVPFRKGKEICMNIWQSQQQNKSMVKLKPPPPLINR